MEFPDIDPSFLLGDIWDDDLASSVGGWENGKTANSVKNPVNQGQSQSIEPLHAPLENENMIDASTNDLTDQSWRWDPILFGLSMQVDSSFESEYPLEGKVDDITGDSRERKKEESSAVLPSQLNLDTSESSSQLLDQKNVGNGRRDLSQSIGNSINSAGGSNVAAQSMSSPPPTSLQSYQAMINEQQYHHMHPLAMTSLSRCPPYVNIGSIQSNGVALSMSSSDANAGLAASLINAPVNSLVVSDSINEVSPVLSTLPPAASNSLDLVTNSSDIYSSLNSYAQAISSNPSMAQNSQNYHSLPSWKNSMGDIMYSSLFNIGILNNNNINNSNGSIFLNPGISSCLQNSINTAFNNSHSANANRSTTHNVDKSSNPSGDVDTPVHHSGIAINGFYPQVNAQSVVPTVGFGSGMPINKHGINVGNNIDGTININNASRLMSSSSSNSKRTQYEDLSISSSTPLISQLSSAHQKHIQEKRDKATKERNEREQLRAKKITEVIQQLRENMQKEGWRGEMKSKHETLLQCKAYMEYLKENLRAKESNIEQTKRLLEENATLDGRSDPEGIPDSVVSSLTTSSSPSTSNEKKNNYLCDYQGQGSKRRRRSILISDDKRDNFYLTTKNEILNRASLDKSFMPSQSLSGERKGDYGPGGKSISFKKIYSSISDMSETFRSSIDGSDSMIGRNDETDKTIHEQLQSNRSSHFTKNNNICLHSTSTISDFELNGSDSSTSVSAQGKIQKSLYYHRCLENREFVKEENKRTNKDETTTPSKRKRRGFDYDYREVFLNSNLPQLIAALSGRIIVWNKFFLLATGLNENEVKRLTIFNIVESSQLSSLFKMVGVALAQSKLPSCNANATGSLALAEERTCAPSIHNESSSSRQYKCHDIKEWQAMTLNCIPFPPKKNDKTINPNPLYITIALMGDEDQDKRCFHCFLTDCPGTKGALGSVTSELLALLDTSSRKLSNSKEERED